MEQTTQKSINLYYLYCHIRLDTEQIFYIGIGKSLYPQSKSLKQKYSRACVTIHRSIWWKNIVSKAGYKIKILIKSNNQDFIKQKEKEYILKYGRKDKNTEGSLVNMTDGGDGVINRIYSMAEETKIKLSDIRSIPIYCYYSNGKFFRSFKGIKEASEILKIYRNNISVAFKYTGYAKGYFFFKEYKGEELGYNYDPNKPHTNSKPVFCYKDGQYVTTYTSKLDAAEKLDVNRSSIKQSMSKGTKCKGFNLYHKDKNGQLVIIQPKYEPRTEKFILNLKDDT